MNNWQHICGCTLRLQGIMGRSTDNRIKKCDKTLSNIMRLTRWEDCCYEKKCCFEMFLKLLNVHFACHDYNAMQ